jgi:hypothetical protein
MHISESKPAAIRIAVMRYLPNSSFPERLQKLGKTKKFSRGAIEFLRRKKSRKMKARWVRTLR